jgi:predicted amidohydrolase YtcJ
MQYADSIYINAKVTTYENRLHGATAMAILDGLILDVGSDSQIMSHKGPNTKMIDLNKRRVIPGLIDSHLHLIRGGLNYNMELRWDGVKSLSIALQMLKEQARRTPAPQWVRVVGGYTECQFIEKRNPTIEELNKAAPDVPVFVLHLYDRALLNRAALRVCGFNKETPNPPGGEIIRDKNGDPTGLLIAKPNAMILYSTLAKGPKLPLEYQINSTQHFMHELNSLGITSVIDAGGGFQNYPEDYEVIRRLDTEAKLTIRIAYNLFTQKPKQELSDFQKWTKEVTPGQGNDFYRQNGAGEMLVYSAADFEDFREPRPDMANTMENELEKVVRHLVESRWPFRLHATYNETIERALNVFEKINREVPFNGIHWFFDHAETINPRNIDRVKALGGGIAVQHRMAYQGEYFVERYGKKLAEKTPPIRAMIKAGLPVGAGTDATRVASYNPWVSLYWLTTGKTLGGMELYPEDNLLSREAALKLWTVTNTWFSNEEGKKGEIKPGLLADFAVLSDDYFDIESEKIKEITSVLTVLGGKIVFGSNEFSKLAPELTAPMPDWSPVNYFGGYQQKQEHARFQMVELKPACCIIHPAPKTSRHTFEEVIGDWRLGCSCWVF